MEVVDKRRVDEQGEPTGVEPAVEYDNFKPTLAGFVPVNDAVLLRELKLPEEGLIATPDAFAEPCLYCEVIATACGGLLVAPGSIARILKDIGTTIQFSDAPEGQRYFTVNYQDIIGIWK